MYEVGFYGNAFGNVTFVVYFYFKRIKLFRHAYIWIVKYSVISILNIAPMICYKICLHSDNEGFT